jgi:hypothetical protein
MHNLPGNVTPRMSLLQAADGSGGDPVVCGDSSIRTWVCENGCGLLVREDSVWPINAARSAGTPFRNFFGHVFSVSAGAEVRGINTARIVTRVKRLRSDQQIAGVKRKRKTVCSFKEHAAYFTFKHSVAMRIPCANPLPACVGLFDLHKEPRLGR